MSDIVEIKKVDSQGRLILPSDWRSQELSESSEVYVIKQKGYLKVIPKRKVDLTKFFDSADLGVDSIGKWSDFERKLTEKRAAEGKRR
jgi:bifunctional DNA-binding transcriptional regulator/antitoxin component of YhaV-PrlF toxin-antitoxin module